MIRRPPRATRTDTLFPYTTLFRSCYVLPTESGLFLASDVDLLVAFAGYAPVIDWPVLAQHLAAPDLPRRRTCLEGLDELGGGERLSDVAGCRTIDTPWSIWDFAALDKRLTDGRARSEETTFELQSI